MTVLSAVDGDGRCAEHRHILTVKLHRKVIGDLASNAHDNTARSLKVEDIHHALKAKLVEI